jgi:hypothetical protein
MKKLLAVIFVLVLALSLSLNVCAATKGFVSSPSENKTPVIEDFDSSHDGCHGQLVITGYGDRNTLPENRLEDIEIAYKELANSKDITDLCDDLKEVIKDKGINGKDLAISDLFDLHVEGCEQHEFEITISSEALKNFVGLMYKNSKGEWVYVKNAKVVKNGTALRFSVDEFSPFAIIVRRDITSPQTSDNTVNTYLVLVSLLAVGVVFGCKKFAKKA